jgi:hypothetical protein
VSLPSTTAFQGCRLAYRRWLSRTAIYGERSSRGSGSLARSSSSRFQSVAAADLGERVTHFLAWYGYAARGVILCVLAWFLLDGAIRNDPKAAGDTDTVDFVGGGSLGDSAFAVVAIGTIAYGIFMYVNAWQYKFDSTPERIAGRRNSGTAP